MQAIQTKVIPATNTKPTRIKAWCQRGSAIYCISGLNGKTHEHTHILAAAALCHKFALEDSVKYKIPIESNKPWKFPFQTGALPNGDFAHVFIE